MYDSELLFFKCETEPVLNRVVLVVKATLVFKAKVDPKFPVLLAFLIGLKAFKRCWHF